MSENLIPKPMYLPILSEIIERFQDVTAQVRRWAMKLFQNMLMVFAYFFNVKSDQGDLFLDKDQAKAELEESTKEMEGATKNFDEAKKRVADARSAKQDEYNC